ncbi:GDSL-type esterase/lipase family protein [Moraxella marmotae]|uniref:GDSL-type esterase/lipase family protein n=1 Tax=Moraxella marmotae TaxID=3344520 RepID=UPI0035F41457
MKKSFLLSALCMASMAAHAGYLTNYNEPNTDKLVQALANKNFHIVQLGDSHTAGDSMTDALRQNLQASYGDGGMGWAMPMYFSGQRMARYGYDNYQWTPISSRRTHSENYTLGGMIAKPNFSGSTLTIKPKNYEVAQTMTVSIRQGATDGVLTGVDADGQSFTIEAPIKNNTWQTATFHARLPFTITAQGNMSNTALGGWWGKSAQSSGAIVSALGINGAELSHQSRWNSAAWQKELGMIAPELVILAYGTNEAYNNVDPFTVQSVLTERIRQIRQASPNSAVMIISAPESLKSTGGGCGTRPYQLSAIQEIQRQTAQNEKTLFWDWQAAMGGSCSMTGWIGRGKASKDGVHFTHSGYQQLGNLLADDIKSLSATTYQPNSLYNFSNSYYGF